MGSVLALLPTFLQIISMLPSVEQSISATVAAVGAMYSAHPNATEVAAAVEQAIPDIAKAITDNTPAATK